MATVIVGSDSIGTIAENDGIRFYLTPCCQASVTGVCVTVDNPTGIACRACYQPVDPKLDWCELVSVSLASATRTQMS
jgi:hypothetical protein